MDYASYGERWRCYDVKCPCYFEGIHSRAIQGCSGHQEFCNFFHIAFDFTHTKKNADSKKGQPSFSNDSNSQPKKNNPRINISESKKRGFGLKIDDDDDDDDDCPDLTSDSDFEGDFSDSDTDQDYN